MSNRIIDISSAFVKPGDRIVVAVSGGADSLCLAHALWSLEFEFYLHIVHVNHQLRGEDSEADARFVCTWAKKLGLPRTIHRVKLTPVGGKSKQELARQARYQVLLKTCTRVNANKLFTAHHADDQVETFILNLVRGSGPKGLMGIPSSRNLSENITLKRPLLDITRAEIEEYCKQNNLSWREDESNKSLDYRRNSIRHELLPQLREYNPGVNKVLLKTMDIIKEEQEIVKEVVQQAWDEVVSISPLPFARKGLKLDKLKTKSLPIQRRLVLKAVDKTIESRHIKEVLDLIDSQTGASVDLPGNLRAYRLHDSIAIGTAPPLKGKTSSVTIPGEKYIPDYNLKVSVSTEQQEGWQCFWVPFGAKVLHIGPRLPGDYFHPPGGGKKLKDYLIDRKVPRWLRDFIPVLRCHDDIMWVFGLALDQRFLKNNPSSSKIYIKIEELQAGIVQW